MSAILDEYTRKHPGSGSRYQEAQNTFPGGVTHDNRYLTPFPIYVTHGLGPNKWDVDGNEYIDYVSGHGALILGHSHPDIVAAVAAQVGRGTHLGANTEEELRWARAIKALVPSADKMRFHASGTEATLMAMRLARANTGRNKIIKFVEHFHGWQDYAIATGNPLPGVPEATTDSMIVLEPDLPLVERTIVEDGDVAAVILEGTGAHYGQLPLMVPVFLEELRDITRRHGVLLILDEVVTGFRLSPGGAQVRFSIDPDLTTMAKIVAGGLPGGVVAGLADVIDRIAFRDDPEWDRRERIAHPGTFNANPLSAVAGATCLELIANQPVNQRADAAADRLKAGLTEVFGKMEVPGHAHGLASLVHLSFADCDCGGQVCTMSHEDIKKATKAATNLALKRAMLNAGVDMMGRGSFIVSATHTDVEVDRTVAAFEESLSALRAEGAV